MALTINELFDAFKPFEKEFRRQKRRKLPPILDGLPESDGEIMRELINPTVTRRLGPINF